MLKQGSEVLQGLLRKSEAGEQGSGFWTWQAGSELLSCEGPEGMRCLASAHPQEEEVHGCDDVGCPCSLILTHRLTFPATCPAALDRAAGGLFLRHLSEELLACRDHPGVGFQGVRLLQ